MKICPFALRQCSRSTSHRLGVSLRPTISIYVAGCRASRFRSYASISASELQFGQPVYETHPHLLKASEITPGITAIEYAQRRTKLAAKLPKNAIAVIAASDIKYRSGAVFYEFHQDSSFFYLTGFNEPDAVAVIGAGKCTDDGDHVFHLFVRPKDPKAEQWEGARSGTQGAIDVFNADETGDINQLQTLLSPVVAAASQVYTDVPIKPGATSTFSRFFSSPSSRAEGFAKILESSKVQPLKPVLNGLRVLKSDAEINNMRKAGQASGRAFTEAMRHVWTREKDLGAFLDHKFKMHGCDGSAYIPVIAGAKNALMIHYTRNDDLLRNGGFVLVDAGGEYGGYITDITRTWPINGVFTPAQKDLYTAVLNVQRTCISLCRASASVSLDKLHDIAEQAFKDQLKQLGFDMSGSSLELLFPHHLGHYIGLDVHDTPGQSRKDHLQAHQCITIEPNDRGLYIPESSRYPKAFRGMGIRIEDSVCVGEDNPYVLTTEAVKEIVDIEELRK
ncbi:hypothetical protein MMC12_001036 [Toensbergia leucococca]|nr:hypothetical protein [Toensbergia leucococca]